MKIIDLRSDTVTTPTKNMYQEMQSAPVGDDVYGDDPTVNKLEKIAALTFNKEKALFVPTGTMGNLIAVMAHTRPGEEIILERSSHIFIYEAAGASRLAGVQPMPIQGMDGVMDPKEVEKSIRQENIHFPRTGLICVENTHNMAGGMIQPLNNLQELRNVADQHHIPMHLDGARVFNAAAGLGCDVKDIAKHFDSVMFCLSKGLSAPIGSMLVGSEAFINKARKLRKMLGGGMRQVGVIASSGILSIEEMPSQLEIDHNNAQILAEGLNNLPGITVNIENVHTNIINVSIRDTERTSIEFVKNLKTKGILANPRGEDYIRLVTHKDVALEDIHRAIEIIGSI